MPREIDQAGQSVTERAGLGGGEQEVVETSCSKGLRL